MRKTNSQFGNCGNPRAATNNKTISKRALAYVKMIPKVRAKLFEKYRKQRLSNAKIEELIEQELSMIRKKMLGR